MKCPQCGAHGCILKTEKSYDNREFSLGKAIAGRILCGPVGYGVGLNAKKSKIDAYWYCPNCGNKFPA